MGYISTGMGDRFSALLLCLTALRQEGRNPFWPCLFCVCIFYMDLEMYFIEAISRTIFITYRDTLTVI